MAEPRDTDRRLTELEIKASFTEDLVDQLNAVLVRQRAPGSDADAPRKLRDELPPHY